MSVFVVLAIKLKVLPILALEMLAIGLISTALITMLYEKHPFEFIPMTTVSEATQDTVTESVNPVSG